MGKILVIGSLNMDMVMNVDHMPTAGETILCDEMMLVPGGKGANQAYAAGRLGADVTMFGAIGTDSYGDLQIRNLSAAGVDVSAIIRKEKVGTGMAFITVNREGNNSIVVVQGANRSFLPEDILANRFLIEACDIVILQLEIPLDTVCCAARMAKSMGKIVILDPAPVPETFPDELYQYVDVIKPNETELSMLTGCSCVEKELPDAVDFLKKRGVKNVLVTLGEDGVYLDEDGKSPVRIPANPVIPVDTTAAGDTFTAAFAVMLLANKSMREAAEFANGVSAIVVTRKGAQSSIPSMQEVEKYLENSGRVSNEKC